MEIEKLQTYQQVIDSLHKKGRKKHLLFGTGFSMAYDRNIFSYNALSNFIETTGDPLIKSLFKKLNTKNFELIKVVICFQIVSLTYCLTSGLMLLKLLKTL